MKVLTLQKAHRRGFRGLWSQCQRVAGSLKPWKLRDLVPLDRLPRLHLAAVLN